MFGPSRLLASRLAHTTTRRGLNSWKTGGLSGKTVVNDINWSWRMSPITNKTVRLLPIYPQRLMPMSTRLIITAMIPGSMMFAYGLWSMEEPLNKFVNYELNWMVIGMIMSWLVVSQATKFFWSW